MYMWVNVCVCVSVRARVSERVDVCIYGFEKRLEPVLKLHYYLHCKKSETKLNPTQAMNVGKRKPCKVDVSRFDL